MKDFTPFLDSLGESPLSVTPLGEDMEEYDYLKSSTANKSILDKSFSGLKFIGNWVLSSFLYLKAKDMMKKGKLLSDNDLFEPEVLGRFDLECGNFFQTLRSNDNRLVKTIAQVYMAPYLLFLVPKIIDDIVCMLRPMLIFKILTLYNIKYNATGNEHHYSIFFFIVLLFGLECLRALCHEKFYYRIRRFRKEIMFVMNGSLYHKILKIADSSEKMKVINLVGTDTNRVIIAINAFILIPSGLMKFLLSFIYFYYLLGFTSLIAVIVVAIVLIPINTYCQYYCAKLDKKTQEHSDKRVGLVNQVITNIRMIKSFFWEKIYHKKIQKIRNEEIKMHERRSIIWSIVEMLWLTSTFFITSCSFTMFSLLGRKLTTPVAFSVTTISKGMVWPFFIFCFSMVDISRAKISVKRIEDFFKLPEVKEKSIQNSKMFDHNIIELSRCNFTWKNESDSEKRTLTDRDILLKDISMSIKRGEFVIVLGNIGAGKSSLCSALLGEVYSVENDDQLNCQVKSSKISYYSQNHWILNNTIRENILFGSEMNKNKLNRIINSCALEKDLEEFPLYDKTIVGEKGVTLSGGQQARISIARCCYDSENELFIFDDPLKDLDVNTCNHVFQKIFKEELKNKTRILVTHQTQFLAQCDKIIVIKDRKIVKCGSYQAIISNKADYFQTLKTPLKDEKKIPVTKKPDILKSPLVLKPKKEVERKLDIYLIFQYFNVYPKAFLLCFGVIITKPMFEIFRDWIIGQWAKDAEYKLHSLKYYLSLYLGIGFFNSFLVIVTQIMLALVILRTSRYFHKRLLNSILNSKISWFNVTPSGGILSRFSEDQSILDNDLRMRIRDIFFNCISCIGTYIFMIYLLPWFIIPMGLFVFVLYKLGKNYISSSQKLAKLGREKNSIIMSHFNETLAGLPTIRAFNKEKDFINKANSKIKEKIKYLFNELEIDEFICVRGRYYTLMMMFCFVILTTVSNGLPPEVFGFALSTLFAMLFNIIYMIYMISGLQRDFVSVGKILEFSKLEPEKYKGSEPKLFPKYGEIEFKNVSFKYDKDFVIRDLSFTVKPGEKIGICGRTGAGKSSLVKLIFRLYDVNKGEILIDGINISKLSLESLRTNLCYVSQNPSLFHGSLKENLDPQDVHEDFEIWEVLDRVKMKEKVRSLQSNLETRVDEIKFSSGERQLFCFGRALLQNKKILILDECTSACDIKTDRLIQQVIREEFKNYTVLSIAHRLETVIDYNRLVVLEKGRLVEFDTPYNLLRQNDKSTFWKMVMETGRERSNNLLNMVFK